MKKLQLLLAGVVLAFTFTTRAQALTGAINASVYSGDVGEYTSSSLTLFQTNVIAPGTTGDFFATVPTGSLLYAYTGTIDGLSSTSLAVSINNYFVFSDQAPGGGAGGTTPHDRFEFDLATIAVNPGTAVGETVFSGTGTLVDSTGAFSSSPADFAVVFFSGSNAYSINIVTVPEPATLSLAAVGLLGALVLRRRKD